VDKGTGIIGMLDQGCFLYRVLRSSAWVIAGKPAALWTGLEDVPGYQGQDRLGIIIPFDATGQLKNMPSTSVEGYIGSASGCVSRHIFSNPVHKAAGFPAITMRMSEYTVKEASLIQAYR